MYCRKCGKQSVHEGARFCSRCGFPLDVNNSYLQNENMGNNNPSMVPRGQTANIPVCPTIDTPSVSLQVICPTSEKCRYFLASGHLVRIA